MIEEESPSSGFYLLEILFDCKRIAEWYSKGIFVFLLYQVTLMSH